VVRLPQLSPDDAACTITKWYRGFGDALKADQPVVELATDKASMDLPAPGDGVLIWRRAKGAVTVGDPLFAFLIGPRSASAPSSYDEMTVDSPGENRGLGKFMTAMLSSLAVAIPFGLGVAMHAWFGSAVVALAAGGAIFGGHAALNAIKARREQRLLQRQDQPHELTSG
jgi:pyruvate/2-oxoglutarate dehydrogenase complex dihydrolipoamide acyltransferase (E2) component